MNRNAARLVVGAAALATTLAAGAGPASAASLTIKLPCGCEWTNTLNGNAASTPAADNPTGGVGNSATITFAP